MHLRWSQEAADDLERIADYLFEHTPAHTERIIRTLYNAPTRLLTAPYGGRPGKKGGTRELRGDFATLHHCVCGRGGNDSSSPYFAWPHKNGPDLRCARTTGSAISAELLGQSDRRAEIGAVGDEAGVLKIAVSFRVHEGKR